MTTKYYQPYKVDSGYIFGYNLDGNAEIAPTGYCALLGHAHDVPREAIACFRDFLVNASVTYNFKSNFETYCAVCNRRTNKYATVGFLQRTFALCDEHQDAESVNKLLVFSGYFAVEE